MNKILLPAAALAVGLLVFTGCKKDFLETAPASSISDKTLTQSDNGPQGVLNGINNMMYMYSYGRETHYFGAGNLAITTRMDFLTNSVINSLPANGMEMYRWTDHRDPYGSINYKIWDYYYTVIQHCNTVLQLLSGETALEPKVLNDTKAEALAFRAMCFSTLTQLFGKRYVPGGDNSSPGVILRLEPNTDPMPRSTVQECYEQINKDINEAISLFEQGTLSYKQDYHKNHISLPVAYGLAARIALAQQDYAKATERASQAIAAFTEIGGRLQQGRELIDGFNNYEAAEWMWGYRQAEDQNLGYFGYGCNYSYNYSGYNGGVRYAVNRSYYDPMGQKDIRRKWFVCADLGDKIPADASPAYFLVGDGEASALWEITGQCIKFKTIGRTTTVMDNVMMRLGEMYYIKAESEALLGKTSEAAKTLEAVMVTRDPEYKTPAGLSQSDLAWEIQRNKRIDLYWEGLAFFDMKRLGEVPNRMAAANAQHLQKKGIPPFYYNKFKERNTGKNVVSLPKTADSKEWQFVIPYDEIKGNKLCEQNPL